MHDVTAAIAKTEADLLNTIEQLKDARALIKTLEADSKALELELTGLRSFAQRHGLGDDQDFGIPGDARHPDNSHPDHARPSNVRPSNVIAIAPGVGTTHEERIDLALLSRSEAVATVMSLAPGAIDRNAIHEQCVLGGRDDELDDISLSLTGLKRAGRAEKLGKGLWRLVETTPATG